MSKYTVMLRDVIKSFSYDEVKSWFMQYDLSDYLTPNELKVVNTRGTFNKEKLAQQILDAYLMREIGFESVGLFRHYAKTTMREIMGRYAQIIYSAAIEFDPLVNENYTESFERDADNMANSQSNSNGTGFGLQSDTPQSHMNKEDLLAGKYGSNAQASEEEASGNTDVKGQEHEKYTRSLKGNRGISSNAPYLIEEYRKYIINIYGEIIENCAVLFMGIW